MRAGRWLGEGHKQAAHLHPFPCLPPAQVSGCRDHRWGSRPLRPNKWGAYGSALPRDWPGGPAWPTLLRGEVSGCRATT